MENAKENGSVSTSDSDFRVSLFSDLKVTRLGRVYERQAQSAGYKFVAGVDEVGRGCLAGPVVAAACILDLSKPLPKGLNDSKQLTKIQREQIAEKLKKRCLAYAVGQVEADEIDEINILQASIKAMLKAVEASTAGSRFSRLSMPSGSGNRRCLRCLSFAATVCRPRSRRHQSLPKHFVTRSMREYAFAYPQYGFDEHVGYGTRLHRDALHAHGACPLHRRTFHGVLPEEIVTEPNAVNL